MTTTLAQKLQLKAGQRLVILNVPEGYQERLTGALTDVVISQPGAQPAEAVLLFAGTLAEAERLMSQGIAVVDRDGLLWVAYPKGSSGVKTDINRDTLWRASESTGWRPVRQVALDEVWSAIRFRPADKVGR